jgi:hypothetical protein
MTTALLAVTFAMATALPAAAQGKVSVGGRPTPGQSVRLNIVQDADLNMKPAEAAAGSPLGPMHLKAKTTTVVSQKVGTPDAVRIEMTYEDITQVVTLNDQPAPPEATEAAMRIKGKTLSMTVDANGDMIEVTPPADFPLPPEMMKDMMKQALGLMPKQQLAVGETVTAPFSMSMPLPMPGDPPQLNGELKSTLKGVSGAAGSEVASLDQAVSAGVDATVPGPGGNGEVAIKLQVKGGGTTEWDVQGALVKASRMTTTISGTFTVPGVGAMEMNGTTIVSVDRLP